MSSYDGKYTSIPTEPLLVYTFSKASSEEVVSISPKNVTAGEDIKVNLADEREGWIFFTNDITKQEGPCFGAMEGRVKIVKSKVNVDSNLTSGLYKVCFGDKEVGSDLEFAVQDNVDLYVS